MILRKFTVLLLATCILFLGTFKASAEEEKGLNPARCRAVVNSLAEKIYAPNMALLKDAEMGTADPYWGRVGQAIHAVPEAALKNILIGKDRVTVQDLDDAWWLMKSGGVKSDYNLDRFLTSMRDLSMEHPEVFDGQDDSVFRFLKAVDGADKAHGFTEGSKMVVTSTDRALRESEENLLIQALQESRGQRNKSNKWYDWFINYFSPYYKKISDLVKFNENVRRAMQMVLKADESIDDALIKYNGKLSAANLTTLQGLITDSSGKLGTHREVIKKVYGKELSYQEPIKIGDMRLRELTKKVQVLDSEANQEKAVMEAEQDLDVLDKVMVEQYKPNVRPMADYHPTHLQIRFTQYARETIQMARRYFEINEARPKKSDYRVHASWTVTATYMEMVEEDVPYTDNEGKPQTKKVSTPQYHYETKTDSDDFTLYATYNDVLDGHIEPSVSEVESQLPPAMSNAPSGNGTLMSATNSTPTIDSVDQKKIDWILAEGSKARAIEKPLREKITALINELESIIQKYPDNVRADTDQKRELQSLTDKISKLQDALQSVLTQYKQMGSGDVVKQWAEDSGEHFKERNEYLHGRYLHLIKRIEHFREQVQRRVQFLEVQFSSPDYSKQIDELYKINRRNRVQQAVVGVTLSMMLIGGGGSYMAIPEVQRYVDHNIQTVQKMYHTITGTPQPQRENRFRY